MFIPRTNKSAPAALEVTGERRLGGLAHRDQARLAALPLDAKPLPVEVRRVGVEVDDLLGAEAAGVGELEHGPVAHLEWGPGRDAIQQSLHLLAAENARKLAVLLGRSDEVRGVRGHRAGAEQRSVEGPDCGELARHPGLGDTAL